MGTKKSLIDIRFSSFLSYIDINYDVDWNIIMDVVTSINDVEMEIKLPKESDGWYAYYGLETSLTMVDKKMAIRDIVKFINWYNNEKETFN